MDDLGLLSKLHNPFSHVVEEELRFYCLWYLSAAIVPVISGLPTMNQHLSLMQDNAPSHATQETCQDLLERGMRIIFWPPCSPELNLVDIVWPHMNHYAGLYHQEKMNCNALQAAVIAAW